jgi:hypothetical protein
MIHTTDGWLERLQIAVVNRSAKTVIAGVVQLTCPAIGDGHTRDEPRIWDQFALGIIPERFRPNQHTQTSSADTPPPISIGPNNQMTFILGNDFSRMRKKIADGAITTDCTVDPRTFFFSDGTMWSPRQFYKPDPNSEHGYVNIGAEEFGAGASAQ